MGGTFELEPLEDLDGAADAYTRACADADEALRRRLRDDFVGQALPFARRLARRYRGRGEPPEDLEQVARLGLVKTVDRYDPERGSFTAYAIVTITGEIKRHFRNHTWGVHVPRRLQDLSLEIGRANVTLTGRLARSPSAAELAAHLQVDVAEVLAAQTSAAAHTPASLNLPLDTTGGVEVGDLIGAHDRELGLVDDRATVDRLLCHLPERERRMLALRFYGNLSQSEIAEALEVSQMHVSRLLSRALTWLREAMMSDAAPAWTAADDTDHRLRLTTNCRDETIWASVTGEIDRDNADRLREDLLSTVRCCARIPRLVIDLAGVPLLDAAGVAVLLAVSEAARVRGVRVRVTGLQPWVARIVAVSGLRHLLDDRP
jgi:RNA polymerase sigma-B factor